MCLPQPAGKHFSGRFLLCAAIETSPGNPWVYHLFKSFGIASNTIADLLTTPVSPKQAPSSPQLLATTCWQAFLGSIFVVCSHQNETRQPVGLSFVQKLWHCKQHHRRSPDNPRVAQASPKQPTYFCCVQPSKRARATRGFIICSKALALQATPSPIS